MLIVKGSRQRGFTLVEYLIGSSVGLLVLAGTCALWGYASQTLAVVMQQAEFTSASKNAQDRISQQLRSAQAIIQCASNQVVVVDFDGRQRQFTFNRAARQIVQQIDGQQTVLLKNCDDARFSFYQRTPRAGIDQLTPATGTNTCKVVQLSWTCSQKVPGARKVEQRQASARVVLRNQ